jgi:two-component system, NtrC family, sensor histidine kinase HydH
MNGSTLVRLETTIVARSHAMLIRVVDRGPGMDARVLDRATEDFFTTKPSGSGLGLAFARRVLEAHGGSLSLRSEPGNGTTVELSVPAR